MFINTLGLVLSQVFMAIFSGDPELLKEKLLSITEHISNCHTYPKNVKYKACPHPPLVGERDRAWLSAGSLVRIVIACMGWARFNFVDGNSYIILTFSGCKEGSNCFNWHRWWKDERCALHGPLYTHWTNR